MRISPQLGQRNFVASVPGCMGLPQLVHVTKERVAPSDIQFPLCDGSLMQVSLISSMFPLRKFIILVFCLYLTGVILGSEPSWYRSKNGG